MRDLLRAVVARPGGRTGLTALVLLAAVALAGPWLTPFDPDAVDLARRLLPPGAPHWLGTDEHGRDVLARLVAGARLSLGMGGAAVFVATTVGIAAGACAGWFGGLVDRAISGLADVLLAVPRLVLALTLVGLLRPQGPAAAGVLVAVLAGTGWMGVARLVRAELRTLKERPFVPTGRGLGLSDARLLLLHLVPLAAGPALVQAALGLGSTLVAEASLSFLGLGVPPPMASWGTMIADGRLRLLTAPWLALPATGAILGTVLAANLVADALRGALAPRTLPDTR